MEQAIDAADVDERAEVRDAGHDAVELRVDAEQRERVSSALLALLPLQRSAGDDDVSAVLFDPLHQEVIAVADVEVGLVAGALKRDLREGAEGAATHHLDLEAALVGAYDLAFDGQEVVARVLEELGAAVRARERGGQLDAVGVNPDHDGLDLITHGDRELAFVVHEGGGRDDALALRAEREEEGLGADRGDASADARADVRRLLGHRRVAEQRGEVVHGRHGLRALVARGLLFRLGRLRRDLCAPDAGASFGLSMGDTLPCFGRRGRRGRCLRRLRRRRRRCRLLRRRVAGRLGGRCRRSAPRPPGLPSFAE